MHSYDAIDLLTNSDEIDEHDKDFQYILKCLRESADSGNESRVLVDSFKITNVEFKKIEFSVKKAVNLKIMMIAHA